MKRNLSICTAIVLLLGLLFSCALGEGGAGDAADLTISSVTQDETDYRLYINIDNALEGADNPDNYSIQLGDETLTVQSLYPTEAEEDADTEGTEIAPIQLNALPTTWLFLVDISTVSTDASSPYPVTKTMGNLIENIGEQDNAAIITTAFPVPDDLISGKRGLSNQVMEATKRDQSATHLYYAVNQALNYLTTSDKVLQNKVLVVISDGANKDSFGITIGELQDKIAESGVTVYTIAFKDGSTSSEFGSLARKSVDGEEINATSAGDADKIPDYAMIVIRQREVSKLAAQSEDAQVNTLFTIEADQPLKGAKDMTITFTAGEASATAAQTLDFDVHTVPTGAAKFIDDIKQGDVKSIALVALVLVLLTLIIMLIIRSLRQKKNAGKNNYNKDEKVVPPTEPGDRTSVISTQADGPVRRRLQLTLKERNGKTHRAMMSGDDVTVGRQADNHVVLDSNDKKISRHHFVLKKRGDDVTLENISETNGTYINNMRANGPVVLRQNDVIRVGETEMTITWKYE